MCGLNLCFFFSGFNCSSVSEEEADLASPSQMSISMQRHPRRRTCLMLADPFHFHFPSGFCDKVGTGLGRTYSFIGKRARFTVELIPGQIGIMAAVDEII